MVLVGCKTDLRKDKEQLRKLRAAQLEPITYLQVGQGCLPPFPVPAPPWAAQAPSAQLWPKGLSDLCILQRGCLSGLRTAEANRILRITI